MNKKKLIAWVALSGVLSSGCAKIPVTGCSSGWKITGYFTPVESDYPQYPRKTIRVRRGDQFSLSSAFLNAVRTEGWGKIAGGSYVGYYDKAWHISPDPLDALGNKLVVGSIATDKSLIPHGARVSIPFLKNRRFTALDIGPSIKGKHIDIFCGEGKSAENLTFKVTRDSAQVCVN